MSDLAAIYRLSSHIHLTQYTAFIPKDRLAEFQYKYQLNDYREARFTKFVAKLLNDPAYILLKAVKDDVLVGYVSAIYSSHTCHIRGLFVNPVHQGKGVGKLLMQELLSHTNLPLYTLDVIRVNSRAVRLYESFGFRGENPEPPKHYFGAKLLHMTRR